MDADGGLSNAGVMNDLPLKTPQTAAAMVADLVSGATTAARLCDEAIERIERLDGPINAVVVRDFDRARAAAAAADAALSRGSRACRPAGACRR